MAKHTLPLEAPTIDEVTALLLLGKDKQIASLLDENCRLAQYVERLERANSTLHECLAEEQKERELLTAEMSEAMAITAEFFRQANRLRGKGTPRSVIESPESVGLPPMPNDGNGARAHSPTAPASTTHEPRYHIAAGE